MSSQVFQRTNSAASAFQVQQFTRIRDDPCDQSVQARQSVGPGAFQLTNLVPTISSATTAAYQQPAFPMSPGYGMAPAVIDSDSVLRNNPIQATSPPGCTVRGQVQARPFATVPFMGRGKGEVNLESRLQMPALSRLGKECGTVSDSFYANQFTPQIPYVAANIQNPVHLIPEVASKGWVHGGIPSRQWVRDQNGGC